MSNQKIYLNLSNEIQQSFAENSISITDILEQNNIDLNVEYGIMPNSQEEGSRTKDLVPIILASSVAILSISMAISQILSVVYDKPHFVEYWAEEELKNSNGDILLDKDGNPQTKLVQKYELIEATKKDKEKKLGISTGNIMIKFSSKEKAK